MLQPVSIRPALTPSAMPPGFHGAPPGAAVSAQVAGDQVTLVAPGPETEAEAPPTVETRSWLRVGLMAAAAVAGLAGCALGNAPTGPAPAPPAASRSTSTAPETLHMETPEGQPELASTRIGTPSVRPFTGEALSLVSSSGVETRTGEGAGGELRWSHTGLRDGRTGDLYEAADLSSTLEAFQQEKAGDWSVHATMQPAGNAGRFASVVVREGGTRGAGPASERATLRTYDRESGNQVRLDQLVSPAQFQSIVETVQGRLAGHGSFRHEAGDLQELVAQSFSVSEEGGQARVTVGIPQTTASPEARLAEFTFRLAPGTAL